MSRLTRSAVSLLAASIVLFGITAAGAQVTTTEFLASISVDPESPYLMQEVQVTLTLEAVGGPIHGIVVTDGFTGPTELTGNGDAVLEPGETWEYQATSMASAGVASATISGLDGEDNPVATEVFLNYSDLILEPMEATITPSVMQVGAGDEVTWTLVVENVGPYGITGLGAEARLLYEGWTGPIPYQPMTGPSMVSGDGDDLFEPGEQWEYMFTSSLFQTSYAEVNLSGAPDFSPLSGFGTSVSSAQVEVVGAGAIRGTLIDADTGAPIPGVFVWAGCAGCGAMSDSAGMFLLENVPPGAHWLKSGNENPGGMDTWPPEGYQTPYAMEYYEDVPIGLPEPSSATLVTVVAGETSEVVWELSVGGTITGTVRDEQTGQPLSGVVVNYIMELEDGTRRAYGRGPTTTGQDGTYVLQGLRQGRHLVCFSLDGYSPECWDDHPGMLTPDLPLIPGDLIMVELGETVSGIGARMSGPSDGGDGVDGGNGDEVAGVEILPFTGVPLAGLSVAGSVVALLGAAMLLLNRKR